MLAIVVRYFDFTKQDVSDALLDSIEVKDATANGLFKSLKEIPITNIFGFQRENCSVMMGQTNEFQAFLIKEVL